MVLLEGESLFNDATSIVLFEIFFDKASGPYPPSPCPGARQPALPQQRLTPLMLAGVGR